MPTTKIETTEELRAALAAYGIETTGGLRTALAEALQALDGSPESIKKAEDLSKLADAVHESIDAQTRALKVQHAAKGKP